MSPGSFVDSEPVDTLFEVSYRLPGGGDTGVDIGFGRLGSHLFGGEEYPVAEFLGQCGGAGRSHVGYVAEIGTLFEYTGQLLFVYYLLAGGVDEYGS